MQKRWTIKEADRETAADLQKELRIHPVICEILVQRGIKTFQEAKDFFRPSLDKLYSPWLMKDMEKAVDRIILALEKKEKILVFGDYDVDGTTSVATMFSFLRKLHNDLDFYIPNRYREGYGISKAGIDFAHSNNFSLVIALDCGIKSFELISYAKELNIDFIICDHHLPDENLPPAVAILDPKQSDCNYPNKDLCGCGVGFKLMTALAEKLKLPANSYLDSLDLVATAIAADIVSLAGENRILAFFGLEKVNRDPNLGIKALAKLSGLQKTMNISNLVFMIAPRVNAAGRMDDARKAVEMFVATNIEDASSFADLLHTDNSDRKEQDLAITKHALELIGENDLWKSRKSTVLFNSDWHKGVVGIVASRVIEKYYRPTIILTQSGDFAAGSARSVPGFNLYEAIHACREHLIGYGGHFAAAGMTMAIDQIDLFREKFEQVVASTISEEMLVPEIIIDAELDFRDITPTLYNIICQLEPFGPDNLSPIFITKGIKDTGASRLLKEKHLKFSIIHQGIIMDGIAFDMKEKETLLKSGALLDIVYRIEENEWNGRKTLQLKVIDLKPASLLPITMN